MYLISLTYTFSLHMCVPLYLSIAGGIFEQCKEREREKGGEGRRVGWEGEWGGSGGVGRGEGGDGEGGDGREGWEGGDGERMGREGMGREGWGGREGEGGMGRKEIRREGGGEGVGGVGEDGEGGGQRYLFCVTIDCKLISSCYMVFKRVLYFHFQCELPHQFLYWLH